VTLQVRRLFSQVRSPAISAAKPISKPSSGVPRSLVYEGSPDVHDDGSWFILGRSDDVMNVAGKRVAPAEIESVIAADPAVVESAVVGNPEGLEDAAPGDLSGAENPEAVEQIRVLVKDLTQQKG
jgi:acyl-coenzyme A synthetase/AMP-(fatty) acid ligase